MKFQTLLLLLLISVSFAVASQPVVKEMYELRVYQVNRGNSLANLENYLKDALIPSLNRQGVGNVGVFREMSKDEPVKLYLLIPYSSWEAYPVTINAVKNDAVFQKASQAYTEIPHTSPVYYRYESSFMIAFDGLPKLKRPEARERIFELRTYQGYSEDAVRRKIKMFNESEFDIFYETKLNPVFFGEVVAGKDLPCLTYMITFKDMEERDRNWKDFLQHPNWKKVSTDPQYQNTVSEIIRTFLEPTSYSQI